jgi:hypothetical protein
MHETCLGAGQLAIVIFGSIFGTLLICGVFLVLLWQWFKRHRNGSEGEKNNVYSFTNLDSKIFYVERTDKEQPADIELANNTSAGHDSIDNKDVKIEEVC